MMGDFTIWELFRTSEPFDSTKVVGKMRYSGECVHDYYLDTEKAVCEPQIEKIEMRMTKPKKMVKVDRNKYTPHQGKKEMARRKKM